MHIIYKRKTDITDYDSDGNNNILSGMYTDVNIFVYLYAFIHVYVYMHMYVYMHIVSKKDANTTDYDGDGNNKNQNFDRYIHMNAHAQIITFYTYMHI